MDASSLVSTCRRIGWMCMCCRAARPLPSRATARPGGARRAVGGAVATLVAVEATGGFETVVAAAWLAPASGRRGQSGADPRLRQGAGKRAKTDPIDAAVIARFAEATRPEPRPCRTRPRGFCRSGRAPTPDRRDDRRRTPAREACHSRVSRRASPACVNASRRSCRASTAISTTACAARRLGATRRTCSPRCPASDRSSPAR